MDQQNLSANDIVAILLFGSAVHPSDYLEIPKTRKKYWLFGPIKNYMQQKSIWPRDADVLVITRREASRSESRLEPVLIEMYEGTGVQKGGIHLIHTNTANLVQAIRNGDTVGITSLQNGVPLFFQQDALSDLYHQSNIQRKNLRKVIWDEDNRGFLQAWVK